MQWSFKFSSFPIFNTYKQFWQITLHYTNSDFLLGIFLWFLIRVFQLDENLPEDEAITWQNEKMVDMGGGGEASIFEMNTYINYQILTTLQLKYSKPNFPPTKMR